MKNHQARPTSLNAAPEGHATNFNNHNQQRSCCGRGKRKQGPSWAQGPPNRGLSKVQNLTQKCQPLAPKAPNFKNKGKATVQSDSIEMDMCNHCGSKDHWSHICRATHEAIAKYHSRRESNVAHVELLEYATTSMEISDFQKASTPMDE
ncbi:hypothetical protein TB2_043359 [Malus domestica]